jgi:hypothetical protein
MAEAGGGGRGAAAERVRGGVGSGAREGNVDSGEEADGERENEDALGFCGLYM